MLHRHQCHLRAFLLVMLCAASSGQAGEVIFKNGDRLSGDVVKLPDGKVRIKSVFAGEVVVDMSHVASVVGDAPATTTAATSTAPVAPLAKKADGAAAVFSEQWTGNFKLNANAARGNSDS